VVTFINPAAQKMLGYAQDVVVGQRLHALIHLSGPDGKPCEEAACPVALTLGDGQTRTQEEWLRHSDGGIFPVRMTVSPIREGLGYGGAVVVFHDIGELKEKEAALTRLARTDTLTGLNNRGYFLELLGIEISRWQRNGHHVALLMIDLDCFKRVNDTWGHAVGDEVLRHFSEVLRRSLRRVDIAGRLGGEEFAVLLPGDNEVAALAAAERLRQNVANEAASTSAGAITVTISIGVTLFRAGDSSHEQPLRRADQALYRAKQAGRNRVEADFAAELKPGDAAPADR
jgi:diguanylate cyclase (GGDEF)-like protein/PAS domain S-box-containing protein